MRSFIRLVLAVIVCAIVLKIALVVLPIAMYVIGCLAAVGVTVLVTRRFVGYTQRFLR